MAVQSEVVPREMISIAAHANQLCGTTLGPASGLVCHWITKGTGAQKTSFALFCALGCRRPLWGNNGMLDVHRRWWRVAAECADHGAHRMRCDARYYLCGRACGRTPGSDGRRLGGQPSRRLL